MSSLLKFAIRRFKRTIAPKNFDYEPVLHTDPDYPELEERAQQLKGNREYLKEITHSHTGPS